ncbi:HK97 family phage prohead protease [Phreatobacter sp. AB_2022a]|uniref:HK97 family phage prohead protease n=1 Tax=Phreatobacter sp. AB_2022a TaxID=3003134 RepID=UPI0022876D12|nr:HK97 family phage prohead protease [Phreatobacter sp. AB_2022a]MCZ0734577.1 HK97 family phage prohead protease [Phreatobacter sp. AB_2022a]
MPSAETRNVGARVEGSTAEGYAAVFNQWTAIAGMFRERVAPGAFAESLRSDDVLALWNHDWDRPLGRTSAGTLRVREDRRGLWFSLDLDGNNPDALRAISTVGRGDITGMSFGFKVTAESWADPGHGLPERTIEKADLFEISLCPAPAYGQTTVALTRAEGNRIAAARRRAEAAMRLRGIAP